jgi:hypothetical protein
MPSNTFFKFYEASFMYVNGKMRPVETILGMGEWGIKENDGGE